jgi:hypothetical protein
MIRALLVLAALLALTPSQAAVTVVDTCIIGSATTGCTLDATGADVVYICISEDTAADQNFTASFNGDNATQLGETGGTTGQYLSLHRLTAPDQTSGTADSSGGSGGSALAAIALAGVDTGDHDDYTDASTNITELSTGDTHTGKTITSATDNLVASCFAGNGNIDTTQAAPTGTNQTQHDVVDVADGHTADVSSQPGAATATPSWGTFAGNRRTSSFAWNINAAAAGGSAVPIIHQQHR